MAHQVASRLDLSRKLLSILLTVFGVVVPLAAGLLEAAGRQTQTAPPETGIVGTWQGTLHIPQGPDLRAVEQVTEPTPGNLKVVLYSIDQSGQGIPATSASFQSGVFKYAVNFLDNTFEGKMSNDGKSISGTWKQGPLSVPLVLERATADTAWAIPAPPLKIPAMNPTVNPGLEVATIKASKPGEPGKLLGLRGTDVATVNTTLAELISYAYDVQQRQIIGGPDWISSDKFDIEGKPDAPGRPDVSQLRTMFQKLLADRFQLKFHRDTKQMSAYSVTVGKNGPKLEKSQGDPNGPPGIFMRQLGVLNVTNATVADFARVLQTVVFDRPVMDQTGLQGRWDFVLKWTPDESQFSGLGWKVPPPSDAADAPPPLFTAIQEQIGLKLEAGKAPVPVLVLDHVEQPSAN
ncbi:MAG TPA: TIGR03435 family protein [Candidatus Acidoferrales bacterium]|jgi:uncharacterized protein (TIGR03435 family)|nr:TIGR03435 family protein [Candidatus Acidoferrales bacterium]